MRAIFSLFITASCTFSYAQVGVTNTIVHKKFCNNHYLYSYAEKTDTIREYDEIGPVIVMGTIGNEPPVSIQEPDRSNSRYFFHKAKKIPLSETASILGVQDNNLILIDIKKEKFVLTTNVIASGVLQKKKSRTIMRRQFDWADALYSPTGTFYVAYDQNTFTKEEGKSFTLFDRNLDTVLTYSYQFDVQLEYYFVNDDTLCLYECDDASGAGHFELFSIGQKAFVLKRDFSTSNPKNHQAQFYCLVDKKGFSVGFNHIENHRGIIQHYNLDGELIWTDTLERSLQQAAILHKTNKLLVLLSAPTYAIGPSFQTVDIENGFLSEKDYINKGYLLQFHSITFGAPIMHMLGKPVYLDNGYVTFSHYAYTIEPKQKHIVHGLVFDGVNDFSFYTANKYVGDYRVIPRKGGAAANSDERTTYFSLNN